MTQEWACVCVVCAVHRYQTDLALRFDGIFVDFLNEHVPMIVDVVQDFVDRDAPPWLSSDRIAELASVEFFAPSIFTYSYVDACRWGVPRVCPSTLLT